MIKGIEKQKCTGCGVCVSVCPKKCIKMVSDEEGFLYPVIDENLCIHCNLCKRKCHALDVHEDDKYIPKSFVAYSKNESVRSISSSGGIFYSLARNIIALNGVVYGVVVNPKNEVVHTRAESIDEIKPMLGSKYVQSRIDDNIYQGIKNDLKAGKSVLFSGTPCQCGAIRHFAEKLNTEKLYLVSFVCHGVPSPLVWKQYIDWQIKQANSTVENISFRDKTLGWGRFSMSINFKNGYRYQKPLDKDYFLKTFLKNNCLRESCHHCQYKGKQHYIDNDLMLADWWGAESCQLLTDSADKGISAIFINTKKGLELWNNITDEMNYQEIDFFKASISNAAYNNVAVKGENRSEFMMNIKKIEFDELTKMYCKTPIIISLKRIAFNTIYWIAKSTGILKVYKKIRK